MRAYSPVTVVTRSELEQAIDRSHVGDCERGRRDVELGCDKFPSGSRDGGEADGRDGDSERDEESDEEVKVPSLDEGGRSGRISIVDRVASCEEPLECLLVRFVEESAGDDGRCAYDGGPGDSKVEQDRGEKEREDDGDGEGESFRDVVGVLDDEGYAKGGRIRNNVTTMRSIAK